MENILPLLKLSPINYVVITPQSKLMHKGEGLEVFLRGGMARAFMEDWQGQNVIVQPCYARWPIKNLVPYNMEYNDALQKVCMLVLLNQQPKEEWRGWCQ